MPKNFRVPGSGYFWTGVRIDQFQPTSHWIVVKEHLKKESIGGIVLLDNKNAVMGTIVAAGPDAIRESGIELGDTVVYEEWMGGRWAFDDPEQDGSILRTLIMSVDNLHCIVR